MSRKGLKCFSIALMALIVCEVSSAQAQSPLGPPALKRSKRPAVSPYLNLAAAGDNPDAVAFQYYNRVLPDASFRKANAQEALAISELDAKQQAQRKLLMQSKTSNLTSTGHRAQFLNYGTYFPGKGK